MWSQHTWRSQKCLSFSHSYTVEWALNLDFLPFGTGNADIPNLKDLKLGIQIWHLRNPEEKDIRAPWRPRLRTQGMHANSPLFGNQKISHHATGENYFLIFHCFWMKVKATAELCCWDFWWHNVLAMVLSTGTKVGGCRLVMYSHKGDASAVECTWGLRWVFLQFALLGLSIGHVFST